MDSAVLTMDVHTIVLLLCVSSAVAGFAIGRLSSRQPVKATDESSQDLRTLHRVSFFKFTQLVLDVLPILMRQYFRERWRETHRRSWRDTPSDGEMFVNGTFSAAACTVVHVEEGSKVAHGDLSHLIQRPGREANSGISPGDQILLGDELHKVVSIKANCMHLSRPSSITAEKEVRMQHIRGERNMDSRMARFFTPKLVQGDTRDWDMSLLCFALLYSSHGLIPIGDDARQLVEGLRDLRNNKLAHVERCSMPREELLSAVRKMDAFIEYCLPSEWELWVTTSREILDADPNDYEDGYTTVLGDLDHTALRRSSSLDQRDCDQLLCQGGCEDHITISIGSAGSTPRSRGPSTEDGEDEDEFHALMDRLSSHQQFMGEAKARWLSELSAAATSSPFSLATVKFT